MHIFIGGILVLIIFTGTAINWKHDVFIFTNKKYYLENEDIDQIDETKIDSLIENVHVNFVKFKTLMDEKEKTINSIKYAMDLHANNKTTFNEEQIFKFTDFIKSHNDVNHIVSKNLNNIDNNKYFVELKRELFQQNPNYCSIFNEINEINNYQLNNIFVLEKFISQAKEFRQII